MGTRIITVFGGTGFLGRHVIRRLANDGWRVVVPCRNLDHGVHLQPMGNVGQIVLLRSDLSRDEGVARALHGAQAAVNLVGILQESGKATFDAIHAELPARIAGEAARAGVRRLVHVSAIGADPASKSHYARSKAAGEAAVKAAFPEATILRPSIVFGPEDSFFNRFAAMARFAPALPLIGGGATRFQPVFVGDVADAVMAGLLDPQTGGVTYELGGPQVYTFKELMGYVLKLTGRRRFLANLPWDWATTQARLLERLPIPAPLTQDQVELLRTDNVVADGAKGLADLGIAPTAAEVVVPRYIRRFARRPLKDPVGI
ncbi:complex I NDUFA9 subunit family protein [Marinivivus vitaminiproducens]|uniref:complex I NDUFA9 subunit family protein n=1 Tax=Marinivivus vitaminiproducens TaxID=3035935 RepID=UPI00279AA43F|nr:complex I NDUFA9 subunit family protein [Geminicoccaceae bacterium SCSIO 64248]